LLLWSGEDMRDEYEFHDENDKGTSSNHQR